MKSKGFIQLLVLIIAIIVILSALGISLKTVFQSPTGKENWAYLWGLVKTGWEAAKIWILALLQKARGYVKM